MPSRRVCPMSAAPFIVVAFVLTLLGTYSASAEADVQVRKNADGVTVAFGKGAIRLEALATDLVRVRYSANGVFPGQRVPVLLPQGAPPPFKMIDHVGFVTLATGRLRAIVDKKTGVVRFTDDSGRTVLAETVGGRSLTRVTLPGPTPVASYRAEDKFALAPKEAIYGLGQHQSGRLDYRGSSVILEQANREVGIPFLVSSRGYGLLWNDAAHTEVDVASDSEIIPENAFRDDQGHPGGLPGHYFRGIDFDTPVATKNDSKIDFRWDTIPPQGLPHDDYSVRWTGFVQAGKAGNYTFQTASDDGVRLWIDGKPVIDDWAVHPVTIDQGTVHFGASTRHSIRLEYFQGRGEASIRLSWQKPGAPSLVDWTSEAADTIDYVVFYGPSLDKVIAEYRQATGEAPLIPKWALGYWQSKEHYNTGQELLDVASEYRKRREPIDNIVQDWFYWNPYPWGSHKFDPKRYPDPAGTFKKLHDEHFHIMISVWGKFQPGTPANPNPNYDAMNARGYLYPPSVRSDFPFYDAFNPGARALYWQLMRDDLFTKGIDAWWLDASEPEVDMQSFRQAQTAAGLGAQVLNAWPLMHTTAVSEGQRRDAPNKRVFILTRSAFAGQQRTGAATWSGDITAAWSVFANQIPAGLNFCLSGIPYWTTDIGGFFVNYPGGSDNPQYRELYTRWFEYGAFCPLFRSHGTNTPREMWRFGPETEKILLQYDTLRYRLMPYIYSQAWQVTQGGTIMRALVMDFPNDETARESKDEFLFGPSILVCPVTKAGTSSRSVYLPAGANWTDFWTGVRYRGGQTIQAAAPIQTMPLFVRDGAIIPMGPRLQYVDEKPANPVELRVFPGADGAFTLYEDEGDNTNYLRGRYATIPFAWSDRKKTLMIGARHGSFVGMLKTRTFRIVWVREGVGGIDPASTERTVQYTGKALAVRE
ncbi:MAG TPA: TIM-barrel domain-containing protein [Capsulimonadaceae bacterium]|nr:TIM-barrel domain-containing protein [Capsulimonadaceae bacterium]